MVASAVFSRTNYRKIIDVSCGNKLDNLPELSETKSSIALCQ
jgi:hypothetical protein